MFQVDLLAECAVFGPKNTLNSPKGAYEVSVCSAGGTHVGLYVCRYVYLYSMCVSEKYKFITTFLCMHVHLISSTSFVFIFNSFGLFQLENKANSLTNRHVHMYTYVCRIEKVHTFFLLIFCY